MRLRGVKIKSSRQRELGLNADLFQPTNLVRYPRLEGTDPAVLYRRAVLLQRWLWSWASQSLPSPPTLHPEPFVCVEEVLYHMLFHFKRQRAPGPCFLLSLYIGSGESILHL